MTPEAQRIAIAEAFGWERRASTMGNNLSDRWYKDQVWFFIQHLPDYLKDLNAMHTAEKILTDEQWLIWRTHFANFRQAAHSTAAQRAEAFLRTLNLWNES